MMNGVAVSDGKPANELGKKKKKCMEDEVDSPDEPSKKRSRHVPIVSLDPVPYGPLPDKSKVRLDTFLQINVQCLESATAVSGAKKSTITQYCTSEDNYCYRKIVVRSSATVYDLLKTILCAFGLEPNEVASKEYNRNSNTGNLSLPFGFCKVNDVRVEKGVEESHSEISERIPIPGLTYRPEIKGTMGRNMMGGTNVLCELKKIKLAQILDKPMSSIDAERTDGLRQCVTIDIATPKRFAFISRKAGGAVKYMDIGQYYFTATLQAIGTEKNLHSEFQTRLASRCVGGQGGIPGGNRIDYDGDFTRNGVTGLGEIFIDELNLRFAAGKKFSGLMFGSGNAEEDFNSVARWMSKPMFQIYESKDGGRYRVHV